MEDMNPVFPFPFQAYDIQKKFMRELYFTIKNSELGIFESPTGTGKSLSICCGALQWYSDNRKKTIQDIENDITKIKTDLKNLTDSEDWLQAEYDKIKKNQTLTELQFKLDKIKKQDELFNEMKNRVAKQKSNSNNNFNGNQFSNSNKIDKEDVNKENILETEGNDDDLIVDICDKNSSDDEELDDDLNEESEHLAVKIYISSRTHSQLSQFIGEVKRTVFKERIRVVTLASRQHYCINSDVTRLKNVNLINERCLDMQKCKTKSTSVGDDGKVLKRTKTKSCSGCPYYNQNNITKLKERLLVDIMDMEDLVKCGKELKACPYYAARMALDDAQVVLLSHAGIVNSGARSGFSIKLKDNILILDEAHGLTAALENAHSAPVSLKQLSSVKTYLNFYINKYRARLNSKNLLLLNQMNFVVGKLLGILKPKIEKEQNDTKIYTLEDFVIKSEIDHLNLRPLVEFCKETRLAPKLHGFSMRYTQEVLEEENKRKTINQKSSFENFISKIKKTDDKVVEEIKEVKTSQLPTETSAGSGLYAVLDFLDMLCDRSENGRVLIQIAEDNTSQLKYLLLNTAEHFADIVSQCRSVILAGGTMEPISEFESLLTNNRTVERVNIVKCAHVVPEDNVLAVCLNKGPSNGNLNFSYENRMSNELLNEVGRLLRNVSSIVPGGVVCFLPSYAYELTVYQHLLNNKFIDSISKKKVIFREPKSATEVEQVLQKFATAVRKREGDRTGALLLSVVGGKLSEGLNFSDDLGRCVIVIGMPYPNVKSPELQEKMNYLNRTIGNAAGNQYYENLCMKAVNQCIGRAVRHASDYACVLLVDERYSRPHTTAALPYFVQKSLLTGCTFGQTIGSIARFFSKHKEMKQKN
ncbi:PREDICTED: probable ATP-dependent RNA helicase DDX11 isoform X1 [Papilio polytes]|uniref:probable ATP-dependent RNA helicase DDX11 isoform X1 n=1 Tax=Papilio polytes TaxID=76194 RepID=UPI000675F45D|nr:PREDICTED: probable ATP-dependent RNA helicase DDX11 isoform X1 [Papilio polytes]